MNGIRINDEAMLAEAMRAGLRPHLYVLERVVLDREGLPRVELASDYELVVERHVDAGAARYSYFVRPCGPRA